MIAVERTAFESSVRVYLDQCFDQESSPRVSELAGTLDLAPQTLIRKFKECCGESLANFMKEYQVEFAKHLLKTTELGTTTIAYRAGFGTRRSFFRAFKRSTGTTPVEYRKRA